RGVILLKREDLKGAARDFRGFLRVKPDDPLAPKVKDLLASLKREESESSASEGEIAAPRRAKRAGVPRPTSRPMTSAELQKLADGLVNHLLSETYNRKVMRGEKAHAVGDIRTVPGLESVESR